MLPHFCKMYLKYLAGLCHHLAYIYTPYTLGLYASIVCQKIMIGLMLVPQKNERTKINCQKKNITVNGFRTKCERVFFPAYFAWALIIMKAFVSHFICISYSGQQRITYRTKISVSHSFQMNGKKAYKLLLSDNSISILLRSSAVQHA